MVEIIIATGNPKKFRELAALLTVPRLPQRVRWRSLREMPRMPSVREDGRTFRDNALKKARVVARRTGGWVIADDSGLEVDALGGAPGVRSARFAGRHGDDRANNAKLLHLLHGVPGAQRRARFRCVLALADPRRVLAVTEGVWTGHIATALRGRRGFGYDPLFLVPRLGKTSAQLPPTVKNRLSHRGRAVRAMHRRLARLLKTVGPAARGARGSRAGPS